LADAAQSSSKESGLCFSFCSGQRERHTFSNNASCCVYKYKININIINNGTRDSAVDNNIIENLNVSKSNILKMKERIIIKKI
jgi:hypothetical protein